MARRRKTLSQNFLHDTAAVRRIVHAGALRPDALVVEPGAGQGALTRHLATGGRRVIAYEIDPGLAAHLSRRLGDRPGLRLVRGDFLRAHAPREPFAVVGNIPYSRTTDIVRWCLAAPQLTSATLLTQLEYARKFTGDRGRWPLLTVSTWPEFEWHLLGRVGRESFTPVPRTDSAVLRIERRGRPLLPPDRLHAYRGFVAHGFTGVGGSLAATLSRRHRTGRVRAAFARADADASAPVGLVTPRQWLTLFAELGDR
ncbi:rRNA adenine methyltransferase [Streptomyces abyssalis]|uniref:rRNA adenine methyltransferase n=1 Tax=Streptomyces abyssalis TaxID=933944 RepID=A0A1E7JJI8_9ACTN|nr:ErmE/ErmH/ErmO/ErmR family 23S rRNA (adenine(2058)-N(6))-methyltransferase [Streptomyces abyssalis]OEU87276.1 rRNA adenine methyltransferase [Streptomyces abyssalis]OEU87808.1 rRNA adenine methyltransferase [Streptomyces abyssalis]